MDGKATVVVRYPTGRGSIGLRGGAGSLSWDRVLRGKEVEQGLWRFEFKVPDAEVVEFKPVRNGKEWARQRNGSIAAGQTVEVAPYFDREGGRLEPEVHTLHSPELGRDVRYQVFLPPSYDELPDRRHPVLYAQDGQVMFTSSRPGPFDGATWRIDETLDQLWELGSMDEVIVVAVHTDEGRLEMLTPVPDPRFGGGDAGRYLRFLLETLKPAVDSRYRTRPDRDHTALMGSSLGGLFSFWASWTRSDAFGKAACLSSSFWWDGRFLVREVQKGQCPYPRPWLYVDSGAAISPFEQDANVRDGHEHTAAMARALVQHCYVPGSNAHALAFPGFRHDNASWAARLAIPLQLLFPRSG